MNFRTVLIALLIACAASAASLLLPAEALGQEAGYVLLEPSIVRAEPEEEITFLPYLKRLFTTVLMVAVAVPVVVMTYAGIMYAASGIPGVKTEFRQLINRSLSGLLIALFAWLILYTIDPKLVEYAFPLKDQTTGQQGGGTPPPTINQ